MRNLITLALILSSFFCFSQLPNVIPYQGQISDSSGKAFDGNYDFEFNIKSTSGSQLWNSGIVNISVTDGVYSVNLGEAPQTALPANLWNNNELELEISFDDGVNGQETLTPNVRILPVPYAQRAGIADSAISTNGELGWGDSLVLRDASGDVRFVMNPNTGTFKFLQNDTVWQKSVVNSPPRNESVSPNGTRVLTYYDSGVAGAQYIHRMIESPDGLVTIHSDLVEIGRDSSHYTIKSQSFYCKNKFAKIEYQKLWVYSDKDLSYLKPPLKKGINIVEYWYNCDSTSRVPISSKSVHPDYNYEDFSNGLSSHEGIFDGFKYWAQDVIVGTDTFQRLVDPVSGRIIHSNKWMKETRKFESGKTIATYEDKTTKEQVIDITSILEAERTTKGLHAATYIPKDTFFFLNINPEDTFYKPINIEFNLPEGKVKMKNVKEFVLGADEEALVALELLDFFEGPTKRYVVNLDMVDSPSGKSINNKFRMDLGHWETDGVNKRTSKWDAANSSDFSQYLVREGSSSLDSIWTIFKPFEHEFIMEGVQTMEYKGLDKKVIKPSGGNYTETLDDGNAPIVEYFSFDNASVEHTGLYNRHYNLDTFDFIESFENNSGDEISVLYEPTNKIINYDGIDFVEWELGGNITTVGSLSAGTSVFGAFNPTTNNIVAMTMDPDGGILKFEDPTGSKILVIMDTIYVSEAAIIDGTVGINGDVFIDANLNINGNVSKLGGSFKIDHPQDPYNKYLVHSFVESPDMMNVYNGNVTTDSSGSATVTLPQYFESLNMEYRYQLTCIGVFAQAIVAEKVANNTFTIKTDKPGVEVSWQVTGIRKDPYASENRLEVEQDKEEGKKGTLLYSPNSDTQ